MFIIRDCSLAFSAWVYDIRFINSCVCFVVRGLGFMICLVWVCDVLFGVCV